MIVELSRTITDAASMGALTGAASAKIRKKLTAVLIEDILKNLSLQQIAILKEQGHAVVLDEAIREMSLSQLKAVSKKWNPRRKVPKEVVMRDLQVELRDLAAGRAEPMPAPPPRAPAAPRAKQRSKAKAA
jgi:hypothetical protein